MNDTGPIVSSAAASPRHLDMGQRAVIAQSRRHDLASVEPGARWHRLSDPRLEALRRYAVLLREGGDDWASEAANTLIRIGYSIDQIAHARWLVACEPPLGRRTLPVVTLVLLAAAALLAGLVLAGAIPVWPVGLFLGVAAIVRARSSADSRRTEWERNFIVV